MRESTCENVVSELLNDWLSLTLVVAHLQGLIILECALGYFPFCDPTAPPSKTSVIGNLSMFSLVRLRTSRRYGACK